MSSHRIGTEFGTDIHGSLKIYTNDISGPLTFLRKHANMPNRDGEQYKH